MSIEQLAQQLAPQGSGLLPSSARCAEAFRSSPLPSRKDEDWRYTKPALFAAGPQSLAIPASVSAEAIAAALPDPHGPKIVFINGHYSHLHSNPGLGAYFAMPMQQAKVQIADLFLRYTQMAEERCPLEDAFDNFNGAFATDGYFILLTRLSMAARPIQILHYCSGAQPSIALARNLIVAQQGTWADIAEIYAGDSLSSVSTNTVTEIIVESNAQVSYSLAFTGSSLHTGLHRLAVSQEQDSTFTSNTLSLKGKTLRSSITCTHFGENCATKLYGLFLPKTGENYDNCTTVRHTQPNCQTTELYKGIAINGGIGSFVGKMYVGETATNTQAAQSSKNILIGEQSVIYAKPQLEIWTDDVSCSHGCTTGQLDKEALFYMQARGISKESAQRLLLSAFMADVSHKIQFPELKQRAEDLIEDKLSV